MNADGLRDITDAPQITREPWVAASSWVYAPGVQCDSDQCANNDACYFKYYGGELIAESIDKNNIDFIAAAPEMYRAMIHAQQLLLEIATSGKFPTDGSIGRILLMIEAADNSAKGIKPLLLLTSGEQNAG
jgi:hypothetical protein